MPSQRDFDRMNREALQAAAQQPAFELTDFRDDILAGEDADSITASIGRPLSAREEAIYEQQLETLSRAPQAVPDLGAVFELTDFTEDILAGEDADSIEASIGRSLSPNEQATFERQISDLQTPRLPEGKCGGQEQPRDSRGRFSTCD